MRRLRGLTAIKAQVIVVAAIFLQSCGMINTASPNQSCPANAVIVRVYTGSIVRVCGCQEPGPASFSGQPFTCTVPVGTTVFFNYPSIASPHQISILGGPNNGALGSHSPSDGIANPADTFFLQSTGSIPFNDFYQSGLVFGTFTVQ